MQRRAARQRRRRGRVTWGRRKRAARRPLLRLRLGTRVTAGRHRQPSPRRPPSSRQRRAVLAAAKHAAGAILVELQQGRGTRSGRTAWRCPGELGLVAQAPRRYAHSHGRTRQAHGGGRTPALVGPRGLELVPEPLSSPSPYMPSPWVNLPGHGAGSAMAETGETGLLGSLVKTDGHVYSLAAAGDLLYTSTDSKNVRVWKDQWEFAGFKCGSGRVKAILVAGDRRIFTGHQDGKVRIWRASADDPAVHKHVGSLPRLGELLRSSVHPSHYVEMGRRKQSSLWLWHFDAMSCLSLDAEAGVIYSGSWDRTFKVWRMADSRCLESLRAHDDAVNTVAAAGFDALAFTGSADGMVKVWRREAGKGGATRHVMERVLRKADNAVTAIVAASEARVVYVASSDGAVTHWQWRRGAARESAPRNGGALRWHRMAVLSLAVAGRVVVSGSADRTICVWRRDEGADHSPLAVLAGHTGPVKCVAMDEEESLDADGHRRWVVYSGSLDGSVNVWRVSDAPDAEATMGRTPAHVWKGSPSICPLSWPSSPSPWWRPHPCACWSARPGARAGAALVLGERTGPGARGLELLLEQFIMFTS
ncbi:hypothetical protein ACQ4PT_008756 [Festuca glaucescens]